MSETNHKPAPDLLDHATRALRETHVPTPPASLAAATVAAIQSQSRITEPAPPPAPFRRRSMFNYAKYGPALAASVMMSALAGLLLFGTSTASAWQDVVAAVEQATTVTYDQVQSNELQPMFPITQKCYVKGELRRVDIVDFRDTFHVVNGKTGQILYVNGTLGTYKRIDLGPVPADQRHLKPGTIIEQLGQLSTLPGRAAGAEEVEGRTAKKLVLNNAKLGGNTGTMTLWYDPQTKLPVKIFFEVDSTYPKITQLMDNFQWNVPLDDKLFNPEIPMGFAEEKQPKQP